MLGSDLKQHAKRGSVLDDRRVTVLTSGLKGSQGTALGKTLEAQRRKSAAPPAEQKFSLIWKSGQQLSWCDGSESFQRHFESMLAEDTLHHKIATRRTEMEADAARVQQRRGAQRSAMRQRQRKSFLAALSRNEPHIIQKVRALSSAEPITPITPTTPPCNTNDVEDDSANLCHTPPAPSPTPSHSTTSASSTASTESTDEQFRLLRDTLREGTAPSAQMLRCLRGGVGDDGAFLSEKDQYFYPLQHAARTERMRVDSARTVRRTRHSSAAQYQPERPASARQEPKRSYDAKLAEMRRGKMNASVLKMARGVRCSAAASAGGGRNAHKTAFWSPQCGTLMKGAPEAVKQQAWQLRAATDPHFSQYRSVMCNGADSSYYLYCMHRDSAAETQQAIHTFEERLKKAGG